MGELETPSDDRGFLASLTSNVGGGVLMIGLVAALFVLIGTFGSTGDDAPDLAIDESSASGEDVDDGEPTPVDGDDADDEGDGEAADTDGDDAPADEGTADDEAADEPAPDDAADDDAPADDEGTADTDEAADAPSEDTLDPADVSVQVLDGFQQDGGTAADAVAATLGDAGYRIVARNPAIRYDVTTVLWTAGNEEAGEQVGRAIGAAEVREQPGNLSTSVAVHVVVGADRG
ncbi:MAG: LytR C-terminal domain-containing protein [Nitriliruptoraceae bacterium]|nr:LytR C-terminal domain-containing protein [Nitriliruptoraceae bacterium]